MITFFYILLFLIVLQRILELFHARKNEKEMKRRGALEFGSGHYKWIVLLHVSFFVALLIEVPQLDGTFGVAWPFFLFLFIVAQIVRVWALKSLGPYWNTKIIVLPGAEKIVRGPYRFLPHPNYLVVAVEILALPMIFGA